MTLIFRKFRAAVIFLWFFSLDGSQRKNINAQIFHQFKYLVAHSSWPEEFVPRHDSFPLSPFCRFPIAFIANFEPCYENLINLLKEINKQGPLIFVTNDDGIHAPGIRLLIQQMRKMGSVVVVAPDKPLSGTAHAITTNTPLRLKLLAKEPGYEEYSCNGNPADCVKLGFRIVMKNLPDLLVSGINHGSNSSISIIYSGTMAAVFEGAMVGVPSIGFSFDNYSQDIDVKPFADVVTHIAQKVLDEGLPDGVCLNVNIPDVPRNELKGIKICRQAKGSWQEDFDERVDPVGRKYYWLKGVYLRDGDGADTDEVALENKYVSIVPVHFDFTSYESIESLKSWEGNV